ncbi:MAG: hypothetical protein WCK51_15795 [Armatimonadota bacterium]
MNFVAPAQSVLLSVEPERCATANLQCEQDWSNLKSVFRSQKLATSLEHIESTSNTTYEIGRFAGLVNMSRAAQQPFHRWVRYREGYSGELVQEILRRHPIDKEREFVMDPMCGSGSTLVACLQSGMAALGTDVSGYAVLSSRVKTRRYTESDIQSLLACLSDFESRQFEAQSPIPHSKASTLSKYFEAGRLATLHSMLEWTYTLRSIEEQEFFRLSVLSSLEDCSNRKKDGNGLATRPSPVSDVKGRVLLQCKLMLEDISSHASADLLHTQAIEASALDLSESATAFSCDSGLSLGSIIFSPPYANSFDYFESYKLELVFGDFISDTSIKGDRSKMIRNYRIGYGGELKSDNELVELLCREIWEQIPQKENETGVRDGRTRLIPNMLRAYFEDMTEVLRQGLHSLNTNGRMHIVVDQSAYVGVPIPTDLIFCDIALKLGYEVEAIIVCRRANTSGQQLKRHPYLRNLLRESIVTLKKL